MDMQMPVMGGLEATENIRRQERFHELPIIAMTAAAMSEDRQACLAAGMDDHLAKPILPNELRQVLIKCIKPRSMELAPEVPPPIPAAPPEALLPEKLPNFDLANALDLLDSNHELLRKLLIHFGQEFANAGAEIATMIQGGQEEEAAAYLHRIRGAASNLGISEVQRTAEILEKQLHAAIAPEGEAEFAQALVEAVAAIATITTSAEETSGEDAPSPTPEECGQCAWPRARELAGELRDLLAGHDFVSQELLAEFKAAVGCRLLRRRLAKLESQVERFAYEEAQEMLSKLECTQGHLLL